VLTVSSSHESLPLDTERRIESFSELVATAIANAESRAELAASETRSRELAREQAALRRVATLVAKTAKPEQVFAAVAQEVAGVFGVDLVTVCRYESDAILVLSSLGVPGFPAGTRWPLDVPSLPRTILATSRAARIDDFTDASGLDASARDAGVKAAVGAPILVDGAVWGSINIATSENAPFQPDAEERLGRFTDLVATSVSNATMRAELAASRARVVAAADETRRRIERDLHDGAQQRLVTLAVALRRAEAKSPPDLEELRADVSRVAEGLTAALEELRELSRGIHPAVLAEGGLVPALKALGRRSLVRVKLDVRCDDRLPHPLEVAVYYVVSEALTNASKHAEASRVWVAVRVEDEILHLVIRDDGKGGAEAGRGSGLIGLMDRVEAIGGSIQIESPPERGTRIDVDIPVRGPMGEDRLEADVEPERRPHNTHVVRAGSGDRLADLEQFEP
jgi:signal transduction histidine kinase